MKSVFETVAETHNTSLAAAGIFTDNVLNSIERLAQLNIEFARAAFENSAELTLVFLQTENVFARYPLNGSVKA